MEELMETLVDERDEFMVPRTGYAKPVLRRARFLKPSVTSSIGENTPIHPSLSDSSLPSTLEPQKWPLIVTFHGWRYPEKKWKAWVDKMASLHESTWKKAGIHQAIMSSVYQIQRNKNLLLGLAGKWCPETNTFVFPWGEVTITLEDMSVYGFSVLGSPVFCPLETEDAKEAERKLIQIRKAVCRSKAKKAGHCSWITYVTENKCEVEHEAFLSLWLSRFVFSSGTFSNISGLVFPIAVLLARGVKISLAPAILASIYRDLTLLREKLTTLSKLEQLEKYHKQLAVTIWSPFQIVQVWAWERFAKLQPKPQMIGSDVPRFARWHNVNCLSLGNPRLALDSVESFQWRPYASILDSLCYQIYGNEDKWVPPDADLDEQFQSHARCLRACELVGFGCIEQYCPHRVAMQFGMDQDIPGPVKRCNETQEIAWKTFDRLLKNVRFYIPSRHLEPYVTLRYSEWWKQSVPQGEKASWGSQRSSRILLSNFQVKNLAHDPICPPDFNPKCQLTKVLDSDEEDNQTIKEYLTRHNKSKSNNGKSYSVRVHSLSSFAAENNQEVCVSATIKPKEDCIQDELRSGKEDTNMVKSSVSELDNLSSMFNADPLKDNERVIRSLFDIHTDGLELEARIDKLRKEIDKLKADKFGQCS